MPFIVGLFDCFDCFNGLCDVLEEFCSVCCSLVEPFEDFTEVDTFDILEESEVRADFVVKSSVAKVSSAVVFGNTSLENET